MLAVAILAAGKGTRMNSSLPKVLHELAGISLLDRVLASCRELKPERTLLILGHQSEKIKKNFNQATDLSFVLQEPQNGTGHAIQQLLPVLHDFEGELLVLNGDVPLLESATIKSLLNKHRSNKVGVTFLSAHMNDPTGYGRVFADKKGNVEAIIEDQDCTKDQLLNTLTNSGIYCFNWKELSEILPTLSNNNRQKEIYLTDAIEKFSSGMHMEVNDSVQVAGINDRIQLAQCECLLQGRLRNHWMQLGVSFIDPESCTLSERCQLNRDIVILPNTHIQGKTVIGENCVIGPGSLIKDSRIGSNVKVTYSVIDNANVMDNSEVGPFSHLRPQSSISKSCKIGNFVEVKKSTVGEGSKINHLSYIGDAQLGKKVNIGAGTITANYDGTRKHRTVIGDNTKTGANSVLIAPIQIGSNATLGAGSTLSQNVPSNSLSLERSDQIIKEDYIPK